MTKFIKHIILFLFSAIMIYIILLLFCTRIISVDSIFNIKYKVGNQHFYTNTMNDITQYKNSQVLFLGSSHAYRGFDNRIFNQSDISSFNLGSSAQSPVQTLMLLNKYLDILNPEIVVYEICPRSLSSDGLESALEIISSEKIDLHVFKMAIDINNIKLYNTLLYAWYLEIFDLTPLVISKKTLNTKDTYISGGFVERRMKYYSPVKIDNKDWEINDKQLNKFNGVVQLLKSKGISLIIVQSPVTDSEYNSFNHNKEFDSIMSAYSSYYNFNKIIHLNDSLHFYDSHHLNQSGVKIFNNNLIEIIKINQDN